MSDIKGFRTGKRLTKADVSRRIESYNGWLEKYSSLSPEELKTLYPTLRGSRREACFQVVKHKLDAEREKVIQEAVIPPESETVAYIEKLDEPKEK